nr:hypothetical protein [Borrelia duttonii]
MWVVAEEGMKNVIDTAEKSRVNIEEEKLSKPLLFNCFSICPTSTALLATLSIALQTF